MTETAPGALMVDPRAQSRDGGAAGVAHFFSDVRLVRDDLGDAAPGEPGEVVIAGPNVMQRYWGLPDATQQAFLDGELVSLRRRGDRRRGRCDHDRRPDEGCLHLRR